jgi:hypothetical protein
MGTVLLDDELKAKLNGLNEHLEVRDTSGNRVGWFVPEDEYRRLAYFPDHTVQASEAPRYVPSNE